MVSRESSHSPLVKKLAFSYRLIHLGGPLFWDSSVYEKAKKAASWPWPICANLCVKKSSGDDLRFLDGNWVVFMGYTPQEPWRTPAKYHGYTMVYPLCGSCGRSVPERCWVNSLTWRSPRWRFSPERATGIISCWAWPVWRWIHCHIPTTSQESWTS